MNFESEAFISYAHLDNLPLVQGQNGWVADFHRALEIRVAQLIGKEAEIWRDPKLQGNDYFADTLVDRLRRVAVLVSIVSPPYIHSEWTRRELTEFLKAANETGGIRIGDKARVFKVLKSPVPLERHPAEVRPLLGYEFFKVDPSTGKVRELNQVFGPEAEKEYWMKMDDLAHDLCDLLTRLDYDFAEPETATPARPAVYLADTTGDMKEEHETIRRDLQQHGYTVLPAFPLPTIASEMETVVAQHLAGCALSIHLVGKNYSLVPEGGMESVIELQNNLAIERSEQNNFTRLVWIPSGLVIDDERQQRLVERLRMNPHVNKTADVLETSLDALRTIIQERLRAAEKSSDAGRVPKHEVQDVKQLYFIYDQRDQDVVVPWQDFLFEQGLEVIHPIFEGSEAEVREYHEENLRVCHGVMIFYGAANESWLRRKLREVQKSAGYGRNAPLEAIGVCLAHPRTPQKERFRTHEATVIAQWETLSPESLLPFVEELKGSGKGLTH